MRKDVDEETANRLLFLLPAWHKQVSTAQTHEKLRIKKLDDQQKIVVVAFCLELHGLLNSSSSPSREFTICIILNLLRIEA